MNATNAIIRIVKKSKNEVVLKVNGNTQSMTWDEFNRNFTMCEDKLHCKFKPEFIEKATKINEMVGQCAATHLMLNSPMLANDPVKKMAYMATFGSQVRKLAEFGGFTLAEATMLIKRALAELNTFAAKPFAGEPKETPEEYRARKARQAEERDPHRTYTPTVTSSMSDAKGMDALRAKFMM